MKLTQFTKDQICNKLMNATFHARKEQLEAQEHYLALEIYAGAVDTDIVYAAPSGHYQETSTMRVRFLEGAGHVTLDMGRTQRMPANGIHTPFVDLSPYHEFAVRFRTLRKAQEQLRVDQSTAKAAIKQALAVISSDKKLIETWPEAAIYLPTKPTENVPAPQISELQAQLAAFRGE